MAIDVYQRITAHILGQLERGTIPWRKPWGCGEAGHPRNLISGHRYRGINVFLLSCATHDSPYWLTYRQAKEPGGHGRTTGKPTPVVSVPWLNR